MTKLLVIFVFCFLQFSEINAQWKAVYKEDSLINIKYSIKQDSNIKKDSGLFFVYYSDLDSSLTTGCRITSKLSDFHKYNSLILWIKRLNPRIMNIKNSTFLYQKVYTKNVKNYKILFHTYLNNKWYSKDFLITEDGYQPPQNELVNDWFYEEPAKDSLLFSIIDSIKIDATISNIHEPFDFIFGELLIGNRKQINKECIHPFLDKVLGTEGRSDTILTKDCFFTPNNNILLSTEETYRLEKFSNYFDLVCKNYSVSKENRLIRSFISNLIDVYPFYFEKRINKVHIRNEFSKLCEKYQDTCSTKTFTKAIATFLSQEFNDGHLFIEPPSRDNDELVNSPVRLFEINSKVVVAAIFDSTYCKKLHLGDEIVSVNNIPIETLIDSLSKNKIGITERKRSSTITSLLNRAKQDSCILGYKSRKEFKKTLYVTLFYNKKFRVPENFKPKHCDFKILNESIAYFRANRMDGNVFLRFRNHYNEILKCKGLIIDLRGNPGGSSSDGMQIFSMFIDKPSVYHHAMSLIDSSKFESLVLNPNCNFRIPASIKVVIIGDENTACASEDFIQAMRNCSKAIFMGSSRTCGALQSRFGITFPSGTYFSIDCLTPKIYHSNVGIIENKGLSPDIWITRGSVFDLIPYNDKLLKACKGLLLN
jgi:C-terminal processing protease CtpA/Prc